MTDITPDDPRLRSAAQALLQRHDDNTSEADIRGAVRDFLIRSRLARRADIQMESQAGSGRIDLESDDLVIEVKRRIGNRLDASDANKRQLEEYLATLAHEGRPPRLGILTDGKYWLLRRPGGDWSAASPYAFTLDDAEHGYHLYEWLRDESQALEQRGVVPTDDEVRARLGPGPRFEQHLNALRELYDQHRDEPTIAIKRRLWRQLLAAALGEVIEEEQDLDDLFLRHTYLSAVVALALQSAFRIDIDQHARHRPAELLGGQLFVDETGVRGVVESDFFTWPAEVEGGAWLNGLARRIARFDWTKAESDIARILYETVIPADDRRRLGEYYTPDWLAREIVDAVVTDPLHQRVLDPACGSGSFIFAAVRKYLTAAKRARRKPANVLGGLLTHVIGIDVHPAAVHLARATWTFAAREALEAARDGGTDDVTVPIYLGDSLQLRTETAGLFASSTVTIEIENDRDDGLERNVSLEFPRALVEQGDWFDNLMTRFAEELDQGGNPRQALDDVGIPDDADRPMLERTADTLARLHAEGRDHIWAYYARNLVRPVALRAEPVDVIVGNPPWLTYSRTQAVLRSELERQSKSVYHIWTGGRHAANQDVAGLFFARCVDLYLKSDGAAAMVLPHSALQTGQYRNWRDGDWGEVSVDFTLRRPWDLERIEPNNFFPVPACIAFLRRVDGAAKPFSASADRWHGAPGGPFTQERAQLVDTSGNYASPYGDRARNGATIRPRLLFFVSREESGVAVRAADIITVSPRRSSREKAPWKSLDLAELVNRPIETAHVRDVHLGTTLVPYALLEPWEAVLPLSRRSGELVKKDDGLLGLDPAHLGDRMRRRWRFVSRLWDEHKGANNKFDLLGRLDYHNGLNVQKPGSGSGSSDIVRVVYGKAGRPTAAVVDDPRVVIDYTLYWIETASSEEANWLMAVLNSDVLRDKLRPLMPKGQFGDRDIEKHPWRLPIPLFDPSDALHREIAAAAAATARAVADVLHESRAARTAAGKSTDVRVLRADLRAWLARSEEGAKVNALVGNLLAQSPPASPNRS